MVIGGQINLMKEKNEIIHIFKVRPIMLPKGLKPVPLSQIKAMNLSKSMPFQDNVKRQDDIGKEGDKHKEVMNINEEIDPLENQASAKNSRYCFQVLLLSLLDTLAFLIILLSRVCVLGSKIYYSFAFVITKDCTITKF